MRLEYFMLIDRVVRLDLAAGNITCEAKVPDNSTIFEGHFPGYPLMPGVLLIECMAQTAGWMLVAAHKLQRMPFLAAVKDAKLRSFVTPGQQLLAEAVLSHSGSGYAMTEASITCEGKLVCNADITFRLTEFPTPGFATEMRKRAAAIGLPISEALTHD